jgi:pimeloyl-ACP methyl ester carboxylesterase
VHSRHHLEPDAVCKTGGRQGWTYFTDIPAGPLSVRHVADLYIYPNTVKIVRLNGAQVREWLEMSAGQFNQIDTGKTPVHIIVGAYDLTCTPEDARRTADAIPGATLAVMDELGHFPMSEHPDGFRPFFADALALMPVAADSAR